MIATRDFDAMYGGDLVSIAAGESVHDQHELARRFPSYFEPNESGARPRSRHSSPRPGTGTTPRRLEFTPAAWGALEAISADFDGDEVGAGLFGHLSDGGTVVIDDVVTVGDWGIRTANSIEIDTDWFRTLDASYVERGLPSRFCGDFHTHTDPAEPSDTDRRGWKASVRGAVGFHVGVIVGLRHDRDGWPWVDEVRAWVATKDGCVPAEIV